MLNTRQQEIVTGSLLGDGTIWTNFTDRSLKLQIVQSQLDNKQVDKKSYLTWFVSEFMDLGCTVKPIVQKPFGSKLEFKKLEYHGYVFTTRCHQMWNELESQWYVPRTDHPRFRRRKVVPNNLKLTPLTLCVWHMDDGFNNSKDANIELNTQSFTTDEVGFLIERLQEDLGIQAGPKSGGKKKGQHKIYIGRKSYFDYIEMIRPHVQWECFQYKLDTSEYKKKPHRGETHSQSKITEDQVREVLRLGSSMPQKEIAELTGVNKVNVSMILSGKRWSHIEGPRPTPKKKPRITKEQKQ